MTENAPLEQGNFLQAGGWKRYWAASSVLQFRLLDRVNTQFGLKLYLVAEDLNGVCQATLLRSRRPDKYQFLSRRRCKLYQVKAMQVE